MICYLPANGASAKSLDSGKSKEDEENDHLIREAIGASGSEITFGIGYGMVGAFDVKAAYEYNFAVPSVDGLSIGLNVDFSFRFPLPNSLDLAAGPIIHVYSEIFRVSLGLGVGFFSFLRNKDSDSDFDEGLERNAILFQLKPELRFDWFLSQHVLLGLDFDFPIMFYKHKYEDDKSDGKNYAQPWFSFTLHVGYKF